MNVFRRLLFDLCYLRHPPWDSGIVPPEVEDFIRDNPPGRALDLGCGSGTSSLALVHAGWTATGVDFARRAILIAKRKAHLANLSVNFHVADVTRLPDSLFTILYDLVLDIGCFHSLSSTDKAAYLNQLNHLLAPGGTWLLYGFTPSDLESIQLKLSKRQGGLDRQARPSAWFWFQKT
jgi:cyclopropane fatty-acyl-phospholipid synthase-like methyltransferase